MKTVAGLCGAAAASPLLNKIGLGPDAAPELLAQQNAARVAFVKTRDRAAGVKQALDLLGVNPVNDKAVVLKPNCNSADPTPGSTHSDVLRALVASLKDMGATGITVIDRSGMGDTRAVMEQLGVFRMGQELGFDSVVLDELKANDWVMVKPPKSYWSRGFALPKLVKNAESIVTTCCLKTHRYGGHFTLSLKNSVGLAAKVVPGNSYNYMTELHGSPNQRRMIAEINTAYKPDLIVLDGVEAFVDGGPDRGKLVNSEVILAGTDRIAVDAIGVALLSYFGTTPAVSKGRIFEQEQIATAAALGVGVTSPDQIEFVTGDDDSAAYANKIRQILLA